MLFGKKPFVNVYANSLDAYVPELWANESVAILLENMVAANLVHRDFENQIAKFGDVVNTRQPGEFTAQRKTVNDDVTVQAASATNIPVTLNQHLHTSFMIRDGEESLSFKQLRDEYLQPAVQSLAQAIDRIVLGQVYQFLGNAEGYIGKITDSTVKTYIVDTRKRMNINKAYEGGRNLIWTPNSEAEALKLDWFMNADKVGDDGTALREASLGRKFQFNNFMCQNVPSVVGLSAGLTVVVKNDHAAGVTDVTVDGAGASDLVVGQFITFADDDIPHQITATSGTDDDDGTITITPALKRAVANDKAATAYKTATVDLSAGYAAGYSKKIVIADLTGAIEVGTMIRFATAGTPNVRLDGTYSVIAVENSSGNTIGITLDRPLVTALANNDIVCIGPKGEYNFAFHKNALALVIRPLAPAPAGLAISSTANMGGASMRVTMTYDGTKQGTLVTCDLLAGIATLDTDLGAVMLG